MRDRTVHFSQLKNRYFALRHGHSEANELSIIVSDPHDGTQSYGLSKIGFDQLRMLIEALPEAFGAELKIVSSDFLRARESAKIVADSLAVLTPVSYSEKLRERYFGELEGHSDSRYTEVWERDLLDASHETLGVESASHVVDRGIELLAELELQFSGSVILLVAHGDVLQLLQCAFESRPPALHRQLNPLKVAEIRQLNGAT
jgi:probable phosphoglycerate mutase